MTASWQPEAEVVKNSNIYQMMLANDFDAYHDFWEWSASHREDFWEQTVENLNIHLDKPYTTFLDLSKGAEQAEWLKGAALNIADSCFQNDEEAISIIYQKEGEAISRISQSELKSHVNRMANSLVDFGLKPGDRVAIDMPMTFEAVAIYLAALKAGITVVTIADSFSQNEIAVRLNITKPKLLFTQDVIQRAGKTLPLYTKIVEAGAPTTIVINSGKEQFPLRKGDSYYSEFLSDNEIFDTVSQSPEDIITILFSSGTTGAPKAIPWTHTTPIKCASDGFYHHNIQKNDVVCWPTNLGWMMGPWLIFASLINKGTMALYYGAPMGNEFGAFVQDAEVNMLGVVPSIVRQWKSTKTMEEFDWSKIKCFSSTGEASNPEEMEYLMKLADNKPVIEYCGGTEIGGGYVTSTVVQANIASTFSSQALGGEFVLLDDNGQLANQGEMFLIPPIIGLSNSLLNRDHHEVYFKDVPTYQNQVLRKHGDELVRLENGYYKAQGRADDAMNLGGIKVSSIQIEEVINQLDYIKESAAIAISPKGGGPSQLVVYAVCQATDVSTEEKLKRAKQMIRERLNPLFKIEKLLEIDSLPRTASGKVMRRKLRDLFLDHEN